MKKLILLLSLIFLFSNLSSQTLSVNPNPVYQSALASFTIANADSICLLVVDITGKIILTPRPTSFLSPGIYQDSIILDNYPPGIYYVSLKIKAGNSQAIKLVKTGPVGIEQFSQSSKLNIYPNPFLDVITIDFGNKTIVPTTYEIFNYSGQIIHSGVLKNAKEKIDLSVLPSGFYLLKMNGISDSKAFTIIKH